MNVIPLLPMYQWHPWMFLENEGRRGSCGMKEKWCERYEIYSRASQWLTFQYSRCYGVRNRKYSLETMKSMFVSGKTRSGSLGEALCASWGRLRRCPRPSRSEALRPHRRHSWNPSRPYNAGTQRGCYSWLTGRRRCDDWVFSRD